MSNSIHYSVFSAPSLCYLLSSCSQRVVTHRQCTLGRNNYLAVKFFTPSSSACQSHCEAQAGCRYGVWRVLVQMVDAQYAGITTTTP